jgi:hypothetical protein
MMIFLYIGSAILVQSSLTCFIAWNTVYRANLFLLVGLICFYFVRRSLQRHVVCRDLRVDDGVLALLLLGVAAKPFDVVKSMAYHAW